MELLNRYRSCSTLLFHLSWLHHLVIAIPLLTILCHFMSFYVVLIIIPVIFGEDTLYFRRQVHIISNNKLHKPLFSIRPDKPDQTSYCILHANYIK